MTALVMNAAPADPLSSPMDRRIALIDKLRGLMIVLMVLDHVREFAHVAALQYQPTDIAQTSVALFATRWVTHLCAPTFVLLAGASTRLQQLRGRSGWPLSRHLLTRGAWLILLELTIIAFGFNFALPFVFLQVIWAIGAGMILLAALVHLPARFTLILGLAIVGGYALLAPLAPEAGTPAAFLWSLLIQPGLVGVAPGFIAYPLIPWFGIMAIGYGAGAIFLAPERTQFRMLLIAGAAMLLLFAALRTLNGFGDHMPWRDWPTSWQTALSFLNVSKYPPSLDFVLATLGVSLLIAPLVARVGGLVGSMLQALGREPLFVYLVHIYLAHGAAMAIGAAQGIPASYFLNFLGDPTRLAGTGGGLSLVGVFGLWIAICLALWPLARWFADVKRKHPSPLLRLI